MQSRFTKKAQEALDHAAETAAMLGHGYIGSEHLLIGLIQAEDSLASTVLLNNDVTAEKIINLVYQLIAPDNQVGVKEPSGYTPRVRRILENSAKEAARFHADSIGTEHLLIAIIKETESVAARLLNTLGVAIKKLYVDTLAAMGEDANYYREDFQNGRPRGKKPTQTLDQYSRDLTELARNGKLDPVIGRSEEILFHTCCDDSSSFYSNRRIDNLIRCTIRKIKSETGHRTTSRRFSGFIFQRNTFKSLINTFNIF